MNLHDTHFLRGLGFRIRELRTARQWMWVEFFPIDSFGLGIWNFSGGWRFEVGSSACCRLLRKLIHTFLDRLREHIAEAFDLGGLFIRDHGHLVAAIEDGPAPAGEAVGLPCQFGFEVAHEGGELARAFRDGQDVEVV